MIIKNREKSTTHLILESLNNRINLSFEDKMNYKNQVKGFEGECQFDQFINQSEQSGLIINDLLLQAKNTYYQMDSILILNDRVHLYEVKNYAGTYMLKEGTLFADSGHSIQNPLDQVNRKKSYLHNLLLNMSYKISISAYVAYMNPEFYIYSLPPTESILFHGQLENHFRSIVQDKQCQNVSTPHKNLAEDLIHGHQDNYRSNHLPTYTFDDLKKGIICPSCSSYKFIKTRYNRICSTCGFKEKITDAVYRSVLEYQLLFPNRPVNVPNIQKWAGENYSNHNIRTVLNKKLTQHSMGPRTFYT